MESHGAISDVGTRAGSWLQLMLIPGRNNTFKGAPEDALSGCLFLCNTEWDVGLTLGLDFCLIVPKYRGKFKVDPDTKQMGFFMVRNMEEGLRAGGGMEAGDMMGEKRNGNFLSNKPSFASVLNEESSKTKNSGIIRVMEGKQGFIFIQLSSMAGLEGVLEHDPWLIINVPFITNGLSAIVDSKNLLDRVPAALACSHYRNVSKQTTRLE
ncbi:hypothetical protein Tco_0059239 [Tanacetum coccineum]